MWQKGLFRIWLILIWLLKLVFLHLISQNCTTVTTLKPSSIFFFFCFFGFHNLNTKNHIMINLFIILQRRHVLLLQHVTGLCGLSSPRSDSCLGMLRSGTCADFLPVWRFFSYEGLLSASLWVFGVLARHQLLAESAMCAFRWHSFKVVKGFENA